MPILQTSGNYEESDRYTKEGIGFVRESNLLCIFSLQEGLQQWKVFLRCLRGHHKDWMLYTISISWSHQHNIPLHSQWNPFLCKTPIVMFNQSYVNTAAWVLRCDIPTHFSLALDFNSGPITMRSVSLQHTCFKYPLL